MRCQQAFSKTCLVYLISKDTHLVFSISRQASRCRQAFSKPCLVYLISKDTHLVFSMSRQASQGSTSVLKALPGKLDIKRHYLVFSISQPVSLCQQAFSKPCLVNLMSKGTHHQLSYGGHSSKSNILPFSLKNSSSHFCKNNLVLDTIFWSNEQFHEISG